MARSGLRPSVYQDKRLACSKLGVGNLQGMKLPEAKLAVGQILTEECELPTIAYEDSADEWVKRYKEMTPEEIAARNEITSVPRKNLEAQRKESPRPVTEAPHIFQFSGTNFDLLMSVYGSISEKDRPQMIETTFCSVSNLAERALITNRRTMYSRPLPEWSVSYR